MSVTEIGGRGSVGPVVPDSAGAPGADRLRFPERPGGAAEAALDPLADGGPDRDRDDRLFVAKVDMVVSANGKLATRDSPDGGPADRDFGRALDRGAGRRQVKAGAVLAVLDPTFTEADAAELNAKLRHRRPPSTG